MAPSGNLSRRSFLAQRDIITYVLTEFDGETFGPLLRRQRLTSA